MSKTTDEIIDWTMDNPMPCGCLSAIILIVLSVVAQLLYSFIF